MQFLKKNIWTICCLTLVVLLGSVDSAFAQAKAQDLMGTAQSRHRQKKSFCPSFPTFRNRFGQTAFPRQTEFR